MRLDCHSIALLLLLGATCPKYFDIFHLTRTCPDICLTDTKLLTVQPIDFYELSGWLCFPSKIFETEVL